MESNKEDKLPISEEYINSFFSCLKWDFDKKSTLYFCSGLSDSIYEQFKSILNYKNMGFFGEKREEKHKITHIVYVFKDQFRRGGIKEPNH